MKACISCGRLMPDRSKFCSVRCIIMSRSKENPSNGCVEWTGPVTKHGYGRLTIRANGRIRNLKAHRACYEAFNGPIPAGMCVLHRCHNPRCVNPRHLRLGTHTDNMRDAIEHGTHINRQRAKLTAEDVIAIRSDQRMPHVIAKDYGVNANHVCRIRSRRAWRFLP